MPKQSRLTAKIPMPRLWTVILIDRGGEGVGNFLTKQELLDAIRFDDDFLTVKSVTRQKEKT